MIVTRHIARSVFFLGGLLLAPSAWADDPEIESVEVATEDKSASFSIGLDAQVRYELSAPEGGQVTGQFALRRLRPILGFNAFEVFSAKFVPEFAGPPELKDGIIEWAPHSNFSLEAGQFAPPFNWERDGSSDYHQFTERSVANREFQIADGRDIGVQFDWELEKMLDVEAGIFNGAGSNIEVEPGRGNLVTGRVAYAPFGAYHEVEVVPFVVDKFVLMVGAGGYFAWDNAWRDWAPAGAAIEGVVAPANVWSATADLHIWYWRLGLHTQGFYRGVSSAEEGAFESYDGVGFTGQLSFLAVDELVYFAFRYSHAQADTDIDATVNEFAGALQIFHIGNRSKFTLDGGAIDRGDAAPLDRFARLQYQLLL